MSSPNDLVTLSGSDNPEDFFKVFKSRSNLHQNYTWAGDSLLSHYLENHCDVYNESFNDSCKTYYIDPELEQSIPHPYSLANRSLQNICKGCTNNQAIILLGKDDGIKRKITSDIRYFLLENTLPKIDQTIFDNIDFIISLLIMNEVPPSNQLVSEGIIVYTLDFGSVNHNLLSMNVKITNIDLSRLTSIEPDDGSFLLLHIFMHILHNKELAGIFTPYSGKYSFNIEPYEPIEKEKEQLYQSYFTRFRKTLNELGMSDGQFKEILRIMMAILLLGNISFTTQKGKTVIRNNELIKSICQMIGCTNPNKFQEVLCENVPLDGAKYRRDYLAQLWYKIMINQIIESINNYFQTRFGCYNLSANEIRQIHIIHIPSYTYRIGIPSGMLQFLRNYYCEWIYQFYYSDIFSTEYKDLQMLQEKESNNTYCPDNSGPLNVYLDLDSKDKNGLLDIIEDYSIKDETVGICMKYIKTNCETYQKYLKLKGSNASIYHFNCSLEIEYDFREILYTNQCPFNPNDIYKLHSLSSISSLSNWKSNLYFKSTIEKIQFETNELLKIISNSDHLYCNSIILNNKSTNLLYEELQVMELQPLIRVHKFGYPLRLDFEQFIDCFQSLEESNSLPKKDLRERCFQILQSIPSLNPIDYIVTESKVFLKYDKERVMVSALWEKHGRNKRSYSRSRAQTCGELFPRGIGTSSLLEKFAKTIPDKYNDTQQNDSIISSSLIDNYDEEYLEPEIIICDSTDSLHSNIDNNTNLSSLEGKARALLVMMSSLGEYDKMLPIVHCMRILFSSPGICDSNLHNDYLLQLAQAIESFHLAAYQNESSILNYSNPENSQLGGVFGEIKRLQELVDYFYKNPNNIVQYQTCTEFIQLSKRRIEHEVYVPPHYRNFDFINRICRCFLVIWKYSEPKETIQNYFVEQGLLELLLLILSDPITSLTLKYTISGVLKIIVKHNRIQEWFAKGNGIRSILQVFTHFYEDSSYTLNSISEYQKTINFLYQCLLSLSSNNDFIQSLYHIIRFHRISNSFNIPHILQQGIKYHKDYNILKIILKLIEKFAIVYSPNSEYTQSGLIKNLVQLLDDSHIFYETACVLSILYLPEYIPINGSMDNEIKGSICLLFKHLLLSLPSSSRLLQSHFENYTFVISQLTYYSEACQQELLQIIGETSLQQFMENNQQIQVQQIIKLCTLLKNSPISMQRILNQIENNLKLNELQYTNNQ